MTLPKDNFILLSMVNMKLRDEYPSLQDFCDSEGVDITDLESRLSSAGFEYMPSINQFR